MPSVARAILSSWSFPAWVTALNLFSALVYMRGWLGLQRLLPSRFTPARLASFLGGIAVLQIALASPIDAFDPFLLADHMFQHMLLMMIVPPLLLCADPVLPFLHGLPRPVARSVFGPILRSRAIVSLGRALADPPLALLLMSAAMIGWHLTGPYELAVRSPGWHEAEHATFLLASLIFWWPVIQPWPSRARRNAWVLPVYLLLADFVNSAVSAFLVFSGRVYYPSYLDMPRLGGISAQNDQVAAGMIMWVIGSLAFLIPAVVITARLLSPVRPEASIARRRAGRAALPLGRALLVLSMAAPVAALAYGYGIPEKTDIDGDVVRAQVEAGNLRISVFTAPDPVSGDDFDVSVLVQDVADSAAVLDADVEIEVQPAGNTKAGAQFGRATRAQSQNKLLYAATLDLSGAAIWDLRVTVRRRGDQATVRCRIVTASPEAHAVAK